MSDIDLIKMAQALKLDTIYIGNKTVVDIPNSNFNRPGLQLAGYFTYYAEKRAQVIGMVEMSYIYSLDKDEQKKRVDEYFSHGLPFLVITRNLDIPSCLTEAAKNYDVPLFRSSMATTDLIREMTFYLEDMILPSTVIHGVMLDIFGQGVMITGQSGIGKSETALELLQRGSKLVADDAVNIKKKFGDKLVATAPELIKYVMEIRGIGIIDVKAMFGVGSVVESKEIDLMVKLENWDQNKTYERLGMTREYEEILGVKIPCVTIPVRPGRNMASVLEVAARNERLKEMGYNAAEVLNNKIIKSNMAKNGKTE